MFIRSHEGLNVKIVRSPLFSHEGGDTDQMTEMSERPVTDSAGSAKDNGSAYQTSVALRDEAVESFELRLEDVLSRENLLAAYKRVVSNKGACGVDGMTVEELFAYLRTEWPTLRDRLLSGRYRPQAVRKVEIPKPNGGLRMLGIPSVVDRFIQQALLQKLQPLYDVGFSRWSFGFRPGRSAHQAVLRARDHIRSGYRWVVDVDLEKFFDRVNHDILMSLLARRIADKRILRLIRRYLQAGIMSDGVVSPRTSGTPQGSPLSPLLSNILLDELDRELERRGHRFVRYADDVNIYVRSRRAGERVLRSLTGFLEGRLRLGVNARKSAVGRPWHRKFLGYSFTPHRESKLRIAPESVQRLKAKLREYFRRGRGRSLRRVLHELTPVLRGWYHYFRLSEIKSTFEQLDQWIRRRLRLILWRQWKRPRTRACRLMQFGLSRERAYQSAYNGRGPWWNSGASHMNAAITTRWLRKQGLYIFMEQRVRT